MKKVLLIEDDENNLFFFKIVLENELGVETVEARSGDEALRRACENDVDLVLMDLQIPPPSGEELILSLKRTLKNKVPIIILTANPLPQAKEQCWKFGVAEYLFKPISPQELVSKLSPYLT